MKPKCSEAMTQLIDEIKANMPHDTSSTYLCKDHCMGCSKKLLEFLTCEIHNWEAKLNAQQTPKLGDINQLAKLAKKIFVVLERNGVIDSEHS